MDRYALYILLQAEVQGQGISRTDVSEGREGCAVTGEPTWEFFPRTAIFGSSLWLTSPRAHGARMFSYLVREWGCLTPAKAPVEVPWLPHLVHPGASKWGEVSCDEFVMWTQTFSSDPKREVYSLPAVAMMHSGAVHPTCPPNQGRILGFSLWLIGIVTSHLYLCSSSYLFTPCLGFSCFMDLWEI